jgi:hypothetical protein
MYSHEQPTRGDSQFYELGRGLSTSRREQNSMLRNVRQGLGLRRILWDDVIVEDREQWRTLINMIINRLVP